MHAPYLISAGTQPIEKNELLIEATLYESSEILTGGADPQLWIAELKQPNRS
jgi:hypothetical protein